MQNYGSQYSGSQRKYYNGLMGPNPIEKASGWHDGNPGKPIMNAMTASNQKSQYGYHQVDESNHDLDQHGKREQKVNRYGSEIQAHNGASMRPYPGHINSTHTQHNQNSYTDDQAMTGKHGGHYLTDQPCHGPSGMEYGDIGGQPKIYKEHKKGGRMIYKSKVTNMPSTKGSYNRYRNKYNYSDSEYDSSSSDYDDDESSSDSESDFDCDGRGRRTVKLVLQFN